jgi:CubicO group peptidase (beta-lactamase class C family)
VKTWRLLVIILKKHRIFIKMKTKILFSLIMMLTLMFGTIVPGQKAAGTQINEIFSQWNKPVPGLSVSVVSDGKVIFSKGYGLANLEYNIAAGPSTLYQVASVSKQVTAMSVLILENKGKLSLNDNLSKYFPEMPDYARGITLKHLIYHTSGLRDYWEVLEAAGWRYDDVITRDQVLEMVYRQKGLTSRPGYEEIYTNTGYMLLAEVVSKVSGMPFAEFVHENIFKPLKMNHSYILDDNEEIIKNAACSYHQADGMYKKSLLNNNVIGSTNLYTTVEDMSLWTLNLMKPVVGNNDMIKRMLTRGTLDNGDSTNYAMGLDTGPYKGLMLIGHRGAEAGYRSFFGMFPAQKLTIIVFSNSAEADPTALGLKVADLVLKDKFPPEQSAVTPKIEAGTQQKAEYSGNKSVLALFAGQYELRPGYIISVTCEEDGLYVEAHEVPKSRLERVSEKEFTLPLMNAKLTFSGNPDGSASNINLDLNGQQIIAPRLRDFDPATVNIGEYTGTFYSPELRTVYTFVPKDKELAVQHQRMADISFKPTSMEQFSIGKRRLDFVRDSDGKITGFMYSSGRIKNIWFMRVQ